MKTKYIIKSMVAASLLFAACTKESSTPSNKPLPPEGTSLVRLGGIRLSDASTSAQNSSSRATTSNLAENTTLRLYAMKTGEREIYKSIATRTYTVDDTGAPVLDAGQEPLFLPLGEVDIYLAGPVTHNIGTAEVPDLTDVAGSYQITPRQGVDLIAGYTAATIVMGNTNALPDVILTHKMAKVQMVIERHASGAYENLVVKEAKFYAQPTGGVYTLDNTGGKIAPSDITSDIAIATIAEMTKNERYSATTLLIPQGEKEQKIETTFECNQTNTDAGDNHPTMRYRQSGLITTELGGGTATRFSASPLTPIEIKWRTTLIPWDGVDQGTIVMPGMSKPNPPTASEYLTINGLKWAKGHLVAVNRSECRVGAATDGGLYFETGGLIGYKGGSEANKGTGVGMPVKANKDYWVGTTYSWDNDAMVWPLEMVGTKSSLTNTLGQNISTLTDYYFNYSANGWTTGNARDFNRSIPGDKGTGTLGDGRYIAKGVGDPCTYYLGAPWRLPTDVEIKSLLSNGLGGWASNNGTDGRWVGPNAGSGNASTAIFFPASGLRGYVSLLGFYEVGAECNSLSSTITTYKDFYRLLLNKTSNTSGNSERNFGIPVRCVSDR